MLVETPEILNGAVDFETFHSLLRKERNYLVLRILFFLLDLYYGLSVVEASKKHNIVKETGYKYARIWRTEGIKNLTYEYGDGRPSKLSKNDVMIVKSEIREGNISNVDDLVDFILKNFKTIYSKSWGYEFFKTLSLEDGIKYPLHKEEKTENNQIKDHENQSNIIINEYGLKCLKVSKRLYFIKYDEINQLSNYINDETNRKMLKRYLFINGLNNGYKLDDMVTILDISISSARKWLKLWNNNGLNGLKIEWGEGRPSYLSNSQKQEVRKFIKNNNVSRHSEVRKFILKSFGVEYSLKHIYRLLKKN
ncbi:MAG: hypothetical protein LBU40_06910 [Methanobrevibacter sp.]|jgi:transposase|nr:hypothetical protein [Methanobrevibacter sp.]